MVLGLSIVGVDPQQALALSIVFGTLWFCPEFQEAFCGYCIGQVRLKRVNDLSDTAKDRHSEFPYSARPITCFRMEPM